MTRLKFALATALSLPSWRRRKRRTIEIAIGHQSTVTNTVPGGVILEKLKLLEKHLPKTGKYKGVKYEVVYRDYTSGPPITNQMLAGRLAFGVMGDYPLIVNGATFEKTGRSETRFIMVTGYNLKGTGNALVVPTNSNVYSIEQLVRKNVSTPFGSAAWGMILKVLRDRDLFGKITLVNQGPPVGVNNIAQGRIDGHVDFCPWSEVMEFRGTGRNFSTAARSASRRSTAPWCRRRSPNSIRRSCRPTSTRRLRRRNGSRPTPVQAAVKVSEWTGIEKEVLYLYFSKGGISTFEASIKPQWVEALRYDHSLLAKENQIPPLTFERWDRAALREGGLRGQGQELRHAAIERRRYAKNRTSACRTRSGIRATAYRATLA